MNTNISDDELVWEHAGARLGGVTRGKMQLGLGDGSGSLKRDLYEDLEGPGCTCCINPLCRGSLCLRLCGRVFGKDQGVMSCYP